MWLSRWCGFDYRMPLGARELVVRAEMTERAWLSFDPLSDPARAGAWAQVVADREVGVCTVPRALVSPEAPRSPTGAYVVVAATQTITAPGRPARTVVVRQTRQVLLRGGVWLVDIAANGAG